VLGVNVTLLPSAVLGTAHAQNQYLSTYLINGVVAIDAGSLGLLASSDAQAGVQHIFLTHSHIDHVGSLPIFLENVYEAQNPCVTVHAGSAVLDSLRRDIFNDRVWPDFIGLSAQQPPFLKLAALRPGEPVSVAGLRLTPVEVNHVVPTFGFVIEDANSAIIISSDTGPTDELWRRANQLPNLRAVFLEATFPQALTGLADVSKHLTPQKFAAEVKKLKRPTRIIAVHIKPRYREEVIRELEHLGLPNLEIGRSEETYTF
jgi:ribonuclease BN (tRNA processing enzyme)